MVKKNKHNGNIYLNSGEILKFSVQGLTEVLANENRCLFCGRVFQQEGNLSKTREHVVPEWAIDHCKLSNDWFVKPNGQKGRYAQLVVRCCKGCNQSYSSLFEKPISAAFKEGYAGIHPLMSTDQGKNLLFAWVAFISAKRRLYSALHNYDADRRVKPKAFEDKEGLECISWLLAMPVGLKSHTETLFCRFMIALPTINPDKDRPLFDLIVDPMANTALVTIGDTSLICGFSHSCPQETTHARLDGIPGDIWLNQLQVKEIFCEMCVDSLSFQKKYYSISERNGKLTFAMDETDTRQILNLPRSFMTEILLRCSGQLIANSISSNDYWNYVTSHLARGSGSFFSSRGNEPYFDRVFFQVPDQEITEEVYEKRLRELGLSGLNKNPVTFDEMLELYKK